MGEIGYSVNLLITVGRGAVFLKMCCRQRLLDTLHKEIWFRFSSQVLPLNIIPRKRTPWSSQLGHNITNKYYKDHSMVLYYKWS